MAAATPPSSAEKIGDKSQVATVKAAASQAKSGPQVPMMAPPIATSDPLVVPARGGAEEARKHNNNDESIVELAVRRQRIIALFRNGNNYSCADGKTDYQPTISRHDSHVLLH